MSELDFINYIRNRNRSSNDVLGIGDDAAILNSAGLTTAVIATDMILEGKHFNLSNDPLDLIGRKALAVNLSDIAAMGARPKYALVSLGLPENMGMNAAKQMWEGLQQLADDFKIQIIGGDTNSWTGGLVINVCVIGQSHERGCVKRSGAKIGDSIFVTGALGGSLHSGHHLTFTPRVKEVGKLLDVTLPTSMIDITDGLARDLTHICEESGVGANLSSSCLPVSKRISQDLNQQDQIRSVLFDGEDFELLFTVPLAEERIISKNFPEFFKLGTITDQMKMTLDSVPLKIEGFEHKF